jgi:hypothetical protein
VAVGQGRLVNRRRGRLAVSRVAAGGCGMDVGAGRARVCHRLVTGEAGGRFSQETARRSADGGAGRGGLAVAGPAAAAGSGHAEGLEPVADGAGRGVVVLGQLGLGGAGLVAVEEVVGGVEAVA